MADNDFLDFIVSFGPNMHFSEDFKGSWKTKFGLEKIVGVRGKELGSTVSTTSNLI